MEPKKRKPATTVKSVRSRNRVRVRKLNTANRKRVKAAVKRNHK